jgi:uncharacterized membrane protein
MKALFSIITILILMGIIDGIWLKLTAKSFYEPHIGHLFAKSVNMIPAIIFYILYGIGIYVFVVNPAQENFSGYVNVLAKGLFFGLIAYGTYDLTNHATLKNWPLIVTVTDMVWGASVTGVISLVTTYLTIKLFE